MSPIFRHIWQCKICCWPVCSRKTAGARCCCKGSTTILSSINPLKNIFFPCRAGNFLLKKLHTYIFLVQWLYFKLEPKLQMLNKYTSTFFEQILLTVQYNNKFSTHLLHQHRVPPSRRPLCRRFYL